MELQLALAKIKMLEEQNRHLSELVSFYLTKPLPAALEYQKLFQESQKKEKAMEASACQSQI